MGLTREPLVQYVFKAVALLMYKKSAFLQWEKYLFEHYNALIQMILAFKYETIINET